MERKSGESRRIKGRFLGSLWAKLEVVKAMAGLEMWIWWANSEGVERGLEGERTRPRERREK